MNCRSCGAELAHVFLDLRHAPLSNAFLDRSGLGCPEVYYPLRAYTCGSCYLTQIPDFALPADIFNAGYVYYSSYAEEFVRHAERYAVQIMGRLGLGRDSMVYEAASNDGYLLQFFVRAGIPCLGVEPSQSVAAVATGRGVPTAVEFFTAAQAMSCVMQHGAADLFIGNNILAHVPDLNDFITGIKIILKPDGLATLEFPHFLHLLQRLEFDTIYHEHYSYFSLYSASAAFRRNGLEIFDVEELPVHGGSLRVYAGHAGRGHAVTAAYKRVLAAERAAGLDTLAAYAGFQEKVDRLCTDFHRRLLELRQSGATLAGYGAAAKGNTLLNYCGIKSNLIPWVADITPAKQDKYLPGSHIPVYPEEAVWRLRPDYIVIFPWNWQESILQRLSGIRAWGGRCITAIPAFTLHA